MLALLEQNETLIAWLALGSVITFFGSLILVPVLVAHMPADYFVREKKPFRSLSPFRIATRLTRNLCGALLFLMGLAMLFLPGQGILTMLIGITLLDFPGKRDFESRLARLRGVRKSIDWIRKKAKKKPLHFHSQEATDDPPF